MGRYPELEVALPATYVSPTRTARILKPGIVLAMVLLLGSTSLAGTVVAGMVISKPGPHTKSTNATQAFALIASMTSFTYIILHGVAAKQNDPVGVVRPPELRLHAACFVVARIGLVMWFVAFISAVTVVSKPDVCASESGDCKMQLVDVAASILAFVATGILLTALEACKYPFQPPNFFHFTKDMPYRTSAFDIIDRSVSRTSSFEEHRPLGHKGSFDKPLPRPPSPASGGTPVRPMTPLLPMRRNGSASHPRNWGEEWVHGGVKHIEQPKRAKTNSDSAISLSYDERNSGEERSSSGYLSSSDRSSYVPTPKNAPTSKKSNIARRRPRPQTVTPSSSISNISRRSPLSTMRSAEFPDKIIRPSLHYFPPTYPPAIPPTQAYRLTRNISMPHLNSRYSQASLHPHYLQRRSSTASFTSSEQFYVRRPNKTLPLTEPQLDRQRPKSSHKPSNIRISGSSYSNFGARVTNGANFDMERNLEEHMQMIEVEYVTRTRSSNTRRKHQYNRSQPSPIPQSPMELPASLMPQPVLPPDLPPSAVEISTGALDLMVKPLPPVRIDTRFLPKEKRFPFVFRAQSVREKEGRPSTAQPTSAIRSNETPEGERPSTADPAGGYDLSNKVMNQVEVVRVIDMRRLSLGDLGIESLGGEIVAEPLGKEKVGKARVFRSIIDEGSEFYWGP